MSDEQAPKVLPQAVRELWNIDWKIGSVLQGECCRAVGLQDKEDVLLWLSEKPLTVDNQRLFVDHVDELLSVRDWGDVDFGIDAEKFAFVVLKEASTKSIDFDTPSTIALRNRFLMSVVLISQIHEDGVACGNLSLGSFSVDTLGKVSFIGLLGGYAEAVTSSLPFNVRVGLRPEGDTAGTPSVAADVYALAVMGLVLFGAKLPAGVIDLEQFDDYLDPVRDDAPPWVLSVLATIVRESSQKLCSDAGEMLRLLAVKDAEYLASLGEQRSDSSGSLEGRSLSLDEIRELYVTEEQLRKRRIDAIVESKLLRTILAGIIAACVVYTSVQGAILKGYITQQSSQRAPNNETQEALSEVARAVAMLQGLESGGRPGSKGSVPAGNQSGEQTASAPSSAGGGSPEAEAPPKIKLEPDSILLARVASGDVSAQDREQVLIVYPQLDDQSKVLLASAFMKAGGEQEGAFRNFLEKQVPPGFLAGSSTPTTLSADSLFLASEMRISRDVLKSWGRAEQLSDAELLWIAQLYAKRRAPAFGYLAEVVTKRKLVEWPRSVFLELATQAEDVPGAPYEVLWRGAREGVTLPDTTTLTEWDDPLSTKVMLAVLVSSTDREVLNSVLGAIVNKPGVNDAVRAVLDVSSGGAPDARGQFARLAGVVGLADSIPTAALEQGLEQLRDTQAKNGVVSALLATAAPNVVNAVLRVYGQDIHPDILITLLERPEAEIRKTVIPFLKEVRISSSKARIRERYELEQDPGVRLVFEAELFAKM